MNAAITHAHVCAHTQIHAPEGDKGPAVRTLLCSLAPPVHSALSLGAVRDFPIISPNVLKRKMSIFQIHFERIRKSPDGKHLGNFLQLCSQ